MEDERKLLWDILSQGVPSRHVNEWLDDSFKDFQTAAEDPKPACKFSKFKRYDPLSFVVVVLNFVREDSAPILISGERPQRSDHPPSAAKVQKGAEAKSLEQPGMSPMKSSLKAFDISSAEEFPSLTMGKTAHHIRGGSKQKRRIRPTPLNDSDKSIEGDITLVGANAVPTYGRMADAVTGRSPICAQRSGSGIRYIPAIDAFRQPRITVGSTSEDASVLPDQSFLKSKCSNTQNDEEEGYGDGDFAHLREVTCGSTLINPTRSSQRGAFRQGDRVESKVAQSDGRENMFWSLSCTSPKRESGIGDSVQVRESPADKASFRRSTCSTSTMTGNVGGVTSSDSLAVESCPRTPMKVFRQQVPSSDWSGDVPETPTFATPSAPYPCTPTTEIASWKVDPALDALASVYVHMMIGKFTPSLATEIHLTVRLLHVRSDATHGDPSKHLMAERSAFVGRSAVGAKYLEQVKDDKHAKNDRSSSAAVLFKTEMDCRSFATRVLLGLKSLLPHVGTDMLDLLEGSLANAFESEEQCQEARHTICQARVGGPKAARKSLDTRNPDDTAIVQSMGAPFAALQWHQHDSMNNCRTSLERALFQNRQASVDRFGSLLRDYQISKKGLQRGEPDTILHNLRTAASTLIASLAPENRGWLARFFLAQLVGWGLAPPEETDSDLMALVAPAGEKGRANLQKLHRRISTPTCADDGNASKSSQTLRLPKIKLRSGRPDQDRASHESGGITRIGTSVPQVRLRKHAGPRQKSEHAPRTSVRVPTVPLQLRWFLGNQEFFYHFLLVLDSHAFNVHLKGELAGVISRLYEQHTVAEFGRNKKESHEEARGKSGANESDSCISNGDTGFTGTILKLKVLAKFLGLLTFSPNWGVPDSDDVGPIGGASTQHDGKMVPCYDSLERCQAHCLLPLTEYLEHAWVTEGLIGAVPWITEFLRMMKWDKVSTKTEFYRGMLDTLASLHSQPCMKPGHPSFTESLFVVSCEVENLFQDLGFDLGVQGYRICSLLNNAGSCEIQASTSRPPQQSGFQRLPERRNARPEPGSLDSQVVLTRRLIQNCCPFLEEVLTLIENLDRAWKQGLVHGGEGTPLRVNPSMRARDVTGISPRSRRTIKPHMLKPIPVLPSVPEHQKRMDYEGKSALLGNLQTESTRLRLVETFFHSLPDEVQATADFVVRSAVHNACEETLAVVVRPALANDIKPRECLGQEKKIRRRIQAFAILPACTSHMSTGTNSKLDDHSKLGGLSERPSVYFKHNTVAAVERSVGPKARFIAGRKGHDIALANTLALVPQSLPLRVRETAAAIAGHHSQQAAERKITEMMTSTVTEVALSFHENTQRERRSKASHTVVSRASADRKDEGEGNGLRTGKEVDWFLSSSLDMLPKTTRLEITSLLPALCDAAKEIGIYCRNNRVVETSPFGCGSNGGVETITSIVNKTLLLVHKVRRCRGLTIHSSKEGKRGSLVVFLSLLSKLWISVYRAGDGERKRLFEALRIGFSSPKESDNLLGDILHLAALAWEGLESQELEHLTIGEQYWKASYPMDDSMEDINFPDSERGECPGWVPATLLVTWGIISPLIAEKALMSFIQVEQVHSGEDSCNAQDDTVVVTPSQVARVEVVTAVVKSYHSYFEENYWPKVFVSDSLRAETKSRIGTDVGLLRCHHPLNFCRLNALLANL